MMCVRTDQDWRGSVDDDEDRLDEDVQRAEGDHLDVVVEAVVHLEKKMKRVERTERQLAAVVSDLVTFPSVSPCC